MNGVVTTSVRVTPALLARAQQVARTTGAPFVERRGSLARLLESTGAELAYVVGRDGESIQTAGGRLRVDVGLLHAKVASGARHPLVRALGPVESVVDGTLGLAGDALHISAATGARVYGAEASPWVAELVSAGLSGLRDSRWLDVVDRISVHPGTSLELLQSLDAVDAVFIAPMFIVPAAAAPGYPLFRAVADHRPIDDELYALACARAKRVVVRVEKGMEAPFQGMHLLQGKAVDYWMNAPLQ